MVTQAQTSQRIVVDRQAVVNPHTLTAVKLKVLPSIVNVGPCKLGGDALAKFFCKT